MANPADAEQSLGLEDWLGLFTNWKGLKPDFSRVTTDPYFESVSKMATGALLDVMLPLYQLGPKDQQFLSLKKALVGDPLASYTSDFLPTPGSYPKWISIPMAAVVPPLQTLFANLQKALGLLRPGDDITDALSKLIQAIEDKLTTLDAALAEVQDALNLIVALAAFLTDSYILVENIPEGGMDVFISGAIAADDAPDFGTAGIVVGITFVATQPDTQATIDKFLEILGIKTSLYTSETTAYAEALDETFSELF